MNLINLCSYQEAEILPITIDADKFALRDTSQEAEQSSKFFFRAYRAIFNQLNLL